MNSLRMREIFLNYFAKHGHTIVPSSSLIPAHDPTLLFANAGMNQFKDLFLGNEERSYTRATSIQKCVRAGGKHNDLDNVGFTKRHLTFFEMMGNFSFGDYFKKEAIQFAWELLTKDLGIDPNRLTVTVFESDDEAYDLWHTMIGLPKERITRMGAKDNFWQMGDTGPCGPCTEIYVDRGPSCGPAKNPAEDPEGNRYLEIWNLVFMQFDRQENGDLKPLTRTGVDTGMGLERLALVLQDKDSVYQTDLFMPIIERIEQLTGVSYAAQTGDRKAAFHVLADHIRSSSLLIADGCAPSNDGRGYVLRKIIRRAALFERKITDKHIFADLSDVVIELLGSIYPELTEQHRAIKKVLAAEVEKFSANLIHGQKLLDDYMKKHAAAKMVDGKEAFVLYDTYGFPTELTVLIAQEHGFTVDLAGFEQHMDQQREQSGKKVAQKTIELPESINSQFVGYIHHKVESPIVGLLIDDRLVDAVAPQQECWVIMQETPFYVERGGQVSDQGSLIINHQAFPVIALKRIGEVVAAQIKPTVALKVGQSIRAEVAVQRRLNTMKNHTATHLLQAALIELFGKQIKQAGSLVDPDYLRFDFTYPENLTSNQIKQVEDLVNAKIMENIPVIIEESTYKDAVGKGVIAFFGDKYNPESVRVVQVPGFSAELCGGTHVCRTGDIGVFKITEVTALSAGQRRIVALTGPKALHEFQHDFAIVKALTQEFKVLPNEIMSAVDRQKEQVKESHNELQATRKKMIDLQIDGWAQAIEMINGVPFVYIEMPGMPMESLKDAAERLTAKKPGFYFILNNAGPLAAYFAQSSLPKVDMKKLSAFLAQHNLRGGGKPGTLQGGGKKIMHDLKCALIEWLQGV